MFHHSDSMSELCVGTVINQFFIATTKYCCESGISVSINVKDDTISSNTFYLHPTLDACLIRVEKDLSHKIDKIPCLPSHMNINRYNGASCWNAGWGTDEVDGQVEFPFIDHE